MKKTICIIALALFVLPDLVFAQPIWFNRERETTLEATWMKARFDEADDVGFLTSVMFVTGRAEVWDQLYVTVDLPMSYSEMTGNEFDDFSFGNPYLGIEYEAANGLAAVEFGVRLPIARSNEEAVYTGMLTDFEHLDAFLPDVFSFMFMGDQRFELGSGFSARIMAGPIFQFYKLTDGYLFDDDEFDADVMYCAHGWYDTDVLRFGLGITGRALLTTEGLDTFDEKTMHQVGVAVAGKFERVEPGIHVRIPVDDDLNDLFNYVVGLDVTVPLARR